MTWYTGDPTYDTVLAAALGFAGLVALTAPFVPTPYGRFASERFGLALDPRIGWFLMELPATLSFLYFFFSGPRHAETVPLVFLCVWLVHYGNRGFYFPFSIRSPQGARASFSLMVIATGWIVTSLHGYLHAAYFTSHATQYTIDWLCDPRFLIGLPIYAVSLALTMHSDAIVRGLRSRNEVAMGERVYRIPRGGLFRFVSSPSYFTELTGWAGLALCTWSLAGVFIFAVSAANLVPRALATHRWYRERFPDYPRERRALIPYLL
jgi:3-oxo-5-alpha-steroid 4-dehydrogenase 1